MVLDDNPGASAHDQGNCDNGGHKNQGQFPALDECNDECGDKSSERSKGECDLLRDTILDQVCIRSNSSGNFSGSEFVKETNVLPQDCSEVSLTDLCCNMFTNIDVSNGRVVNAHKYANSHVHKVSGKYTD